MHYNCPHNHIHVQALRRYLLLGQGDFIKHLMDLLTYASLISTHSLDQCRHTHTHTHTGSFECTSFLPISIPFSPFTPSVHTSIPPLLHLRPPMQSRPLKTSLYSLPAQPDRHPWGGHQSHQCSVRGDGHSQPAGCEDAGSEPGGQRLGRLQSSLSRGWSHWNCE